MLGRRHGPLHEPRQHPSPTRPRAPPPLPEGQGAEHPAEHLGITGTDSTHGGLLRPPPNLGAALPGATLASPPLPKGPGGRAGLHCARGCLASPHEPAQETSQADRAGGSRNPPLECRG
ncbi:hypothetical protein D187_000893 [Cystobacter fuscus DSM 2262]|uniref:Uncharacterized protein n=1 Tax=Cystobacter fuscus (strain ATCC 25194 / DSM 2262 / NBRC 100088 / M29) TaxID=1242864 RepID=S9P9S9_CYSF2|nr:hypothetical protein D187_000893 [Cystobacter fuscus DSM 2262]